MALELAERASCFEILSEFWAGATATITNGYGITLTLSDLNILTADINTRLDLVSADVTACAKVKEIVVDWDCISNVEIELDGGVGDVTGLKYSASAQRERLRKQLNVYVQVLHLVDAVKQRNGPQGQSASFGMSR